MKIICGIDEVGRGPLAGPVVSAAVILPIGHGIIGLKDSKKISPKIREDPPYGCVLVFFSGRMVTNRTGQTQDPTRPGIK